ELFSNTTLSGRSTVTRRERMLDFDWGNGSPGPGLPSDGFSVRWTSKLVPKESGHYLLSITGDDGYRLSLDGKRIIEDWTDHAPRKRGTVTTLEAGRAYDIVLEYYERSGGAVLQFSYAFVGNASDEAIKAAREADAGRAFPGWVPVCGRCPAAHSAHGGKATPCSWEAASPLPSG